jgi:hypothetical protein
MNKYNFYCKAFISAAVFGLASVLPYIAQSEEIDKSTPIDVILKCYPALEIPASTLDLNDDGVCDDNDIEIFHSLLGKCNRAYQSFIFEPRLDVDCDGCLTQNDQEIFISSCEKATPQNPVDDSNTK